MAAIRPVDNSLRDLIKEDVYRQILGEMNRKYEVMEKYITLLHLLILAQVMGMEWF